MDEKIKSIESKIEEISNLLKTVIVKVEYMEKVIMELGSKHISLAEDYNKNMTALSQSLTDSIKFMTSSLEVQQETNEKLEKH